jgi:peptidoglycan/LPS O-acetylase OafA/YrhL
LNTAAARSQPSSGTERSMHVAARPAAARFYRPELDALRFLAFLMVFGSHVVTWPQGASPFGSPLLFARAIVAGGGLGVDLFFVLSAYLITELLLREKQVTGALDVRAFYVRRILRIWPLYFAVIAAAFALQFVVAAVKNRPVHYTFPPEALAAFVFLAGNWYSTGGFLASPVAPLWSVSIEEQFYLLWPLWVRRCTARGLRITAFVLIGVAFATRFYLLGQGVREAAIWCNTFARLDPIAVGILIALTLHGREFRLGRVQRALLFVGGVSLIAIPATVLRIGEDAIPVTHGMIGYPLGTFAVAMIFFSFLGSSLTARQPLLYLGQISYGLYVFHVFGLKLVHKSLPGDGTAVVAARAVVALGVTIAIAAASYRWLEKPFLRLKCRFAHIASR